MKKVLKQFLTLSLILIMILSAVPVQAAAPEYFSSQKTVTLYTGKTAKNSKIKGVFTNFYLGQFDKKGSKVSSVSISNPSIASATSTEGAVYVSPKKLGKAVVTAKSGTKVRKCNLTVRKYTNPVESIKVGNTTISGKYFNTEAYRVMAFSKFANKKAKVTFNLKDGWHVKDKGMYYFEKTWLWSEDVDNGSVVPIKGDGDFKIFADVVNEKTGQQETVLLWLK